jgi:signal transduction histidine kinase
MVRAVNSPQAATFTFIITPPFWRQWWFQLLVVTGAGVLLYVWHTSRLSRQLALERVRSRIATDLHDDIGASLSRVAMMSEVLKTQTDGKDLDYHGMLGDIAETSRSLIASMSDIVWSIDPRHDNLRDLVARLRAFGFDVLEPRGIRWSFQAAEEALGQKLSPDQRRQLFLIFKEAIHNIARHSRATKATLRLAVERQWVLGEIEDDGCGCVPDRGAGLGIHSMQVRAAKLGGTFEMMACPQGGTRATLRFPLRGEKRIDMRLRFPGGAG